MKSIYIGIDASNYTSSFAAVDEEGGLVFEKRILLKVKKRAQGLRQSDAVLCILEISSPF